MEPFPSSLLEVRERVARPPEVAAVARLTLSMCASMPLWKRGQSSMFVPLTHPSAAGILRRCNVKAWCCVIRTHRRRPRQSYVGSISCLVKEWARAKVGAKMMVNVLWTAGGGRKVVRKVYSAEALSVRAVVKALKGISRCTGVFVSVAMCDGRALVGGRVRMLRRRPRERGLDGCEGVLLEETEGPGGFQLMGRDGRRESTSLIVFP